MMLDPETLYVVNDCDDVPIYYGRTPDGVGMYWYDAVDRDEALNDVCVPVRVREFDSMDEFEDYREQ